MVTLLLRASSPLAALHTQGLPILPPPALRTQSLSCSGALSFYPCCLLLLGGHLPCTLTGPADSCRSVFGPQG